MGEHESSINSHFAGMMNKLSSLQDIVDEQAETISEQAETIEELEEKVQWNKVECHLNLKNSNSKLICSESFKIAGTSFQLELNLNQTGVDKIYAGVFLCLSHGYGGVVVKAKFSLGKEGKATKTFKLEPTEYGHVSEEDKENGVEQFKRGTRRFMLLSKLADYVDGDNQLDFKVQVALRNPRLLNM